MALSHLPIVPRLAVGSVSSTVVLTVENTVENNASNTRRQTRRFGGTLVLGFLLRRRGGVLCGMSRYVLYRLVSFLGIPCVWSLFFWISIARIFFSLGFAAFRSCFEVRGAAAAAARSGAAAPRRAWLRCRKRFQQLGTVEAEICFFQTCWIERPSKLKWSC